ncbi:MAG: hypothetical protein ACQCN6_13770 [Candidatus Bathyarchaeia archaeon]
MSRAEFAIFTCPVCGFSLKTPFGKEDLDELVELHNAKHHGKVTRARISKSELIKLQKQK